MTAPFSAVDSVVVAQVASSSSAIDAGQKSAAVTPSDKMIKSDWQSG